MTSAEAQLTAIQDGVTELASYVPLAIDDLQREARAGAAMAASLETVAPAAGSKNRLGFHSATYNGETAVSMSYVRQEGRVDISAGIAISGDETLVKGGVGFSW
jgi:autotransporter adhesin